MRCDECEESEALWRCKECGQGLCEDCDAALHLKGKRREHKRERSRHETAGDLTSTGNDTEDQETVVLYWDMSGASSKFLPDLPSLQASLSSVTASLPEVFIYAPHFLRLSPDLTAAGFKVVTHPGLSVYESIIMDISLRIRTEKPAILILLSNSAGVYRSFLRELSHTVDAIQVFSGSGLPPISIKKIESHTIPEDDIPIKPVETLEDGIPLLHYWPNKHFSSMNAKLKEILLEFANKGRIRVEINTLITAFQRSALIKSTQAREYISAFETLGVVKTTLLQFAKGKSVDVVSIRTSAPSIQLLLWAVRSLQRDEVTPTERAVQTRLYDVYRYKPGPKEWCRILSEAENYGKLCENACELGLKVDIPRFCIKSGTDARSSRATKLIFIDNEEWVSMDTPLTPTDIDQVKASKHWDCFLSFVTDYFAGQNRTEGGVAGGAVNFAQFVTYFGPDSLKGLSLARVYRLVQTAIRDGVLLYENGLLTLRRGQGQTYTSIEKLTIVRQAIVEILGEAQEGVEVEELKGWLGEKLGFGVEAEEMGFEKLTDLVTGMTEVHVESRDKGEIVIKAESHSSTTSTSDSDAQSLLSTMTAIVSEHPYSAPISRVESTLSTRLGRAVHWQSYDCQNVQDFARKWGVDTFDLLDYYEPHLKLKAEIEGKRELHGYSRSAVERRVAFSEEVTAFYSTFEGSEDHLETLSEEDSSSPAHDERPLQSQAVSFSTLQSYDDIDSSNYQ